MDAKYKIKLDSVIRYIYEKMGLVVHIHYTSSYDVQGERYLQDSGEPVVYLVGTQYDGKKSAFYDYLLRGSDDKGVLKRYKNKEYVGVAWVFEGLKGIAIKSLEEDSLFMLYPDEFEVREDGVYICLNDLRMRLPYFNIFYDLRYTIPDVVIDDILSYVDK